jgi:cytochrome c oxidase subunit 1
VLVAGALFSLFSAVYYWFPKMTGRMYVERLGQLHFWWSLLWFNVTFFPMHFLGLAGMPRRIPDYAAIYRFQPHCQYWRLYVWPGQLIFLVNILYSLRHGKTAPQQPWEGANTLEWQSPRLRPQLQPAAAAGNR